MKLRITFTVDCLVTDLKHYEATTLEEAARNQEEWLKDGTADPFDILGGADSVLTTVTAIDEKKRP